MATVRLTRTQRVLAARRHRVRPHGWTPVRDPPAHRRPLPLRGRLPRRLGRDIRSRDRDLRQGRGRSRGAPTAAVRQRGSAQSLTPRAAGSARRPRHGPGRGADHRQALQAHHRAGTSVSTRPCSATSTNSPSPRRWPSRRPRSTRSTASTTLSARTKGCRAVSRPGMRGRPPRRPSLLVALVSRSADLSAPLPISPGPHHRPSIPARTGARQPARRHRRQDSVQHRYLHVEQGLLHESARATAYSRSWSSPTATNPATKVTVTDLHGEILDRTHPPAPGITCVGNGRPRGLRQGR